MVMNPSNTAEAGVGMQGIHTEVVENFNSAEKMGSPVPEGVGELALQERPEKRGGNPTYDCQNIITPPPPKPLVKLREKTMSQNISSQLARNPAG